MFLAIRALSPTFFEKAFRVPAFCSLATSVSAHCRAAFPCDDHLDRSAKPFEEAFVSVMRDRVCGRTQPGLRRSLSQRDQHHSHFDDVFGRIRSFGEKHFAACRRPNKGIPRVREIWPPGSGTPAKGAMTVTSRGS